MKMKLHRSHFTLYILHFTLVFAAAFSGAAKTLTWRASPEPSSATFAAYHGETVEFRPVASNVVFSSVYYQTNGMGQAWWQTDGLVFHPTNDVGAASYRFFLEGRDDLGRDWHANGLLRMLDSPGFEPAAVELPVKTLDFAHIEVANAPWPAAIDAATYATLTEAKYYTDTVAAGKLDKSGGTITGSLEVTNGALTAPVFSTGDVTIGVSGRIWQDTAGGLIDGSVVPNYREALAAIAAATNATLAAAKDYTDTSAASLASRASIASQAATNYTDTVAAGKLDKTGEFLILSNDTRGLHMADTAGVYEASILPNCIDTNFPDGQESHRIEFPSTSGTFALAAPNPTAGNLASLDFYGNPTDSQIPATNVVTKAMINANNVTFSNAVLSVGLGIDTDTVAAINELVDSTHDLPISGATSIGALLLALAAAIAALKNRLPYSLVTKTIDNGAVTLDNRAMNEVAVSSSLASLTVNFPTATTGKSRDFGLRLTVASGITTAPELTLPQGVVCENEDGEAPEIGADGVATILYFTETASGVFLVKGETLTAITQA